MGIIENVPWFALSILILQMQFFLYILYRQGEKVMFKKIYHFLRADDGINLRARELLRYIGPGILVTVGFY